MAKFQERKAKAQADTAASFEKMHRRNDEQRAKMRAANNAYAAAHVALVEARGDTEDPKGVQRPGDEKIKCPHCNSMGLVMTRRVRVKRGISGGKATAAVLTIGWSTLLVGLSRKETIIQATCGNCNVTWTIS